MNIISLIFNAIFYQPMLNFLVWIYILIGNFGISVILLTLIVRMAINPLNGKALQSQKAMAEMQPKLQEVQNRYKDDKEKQAQALLELYRKEKFNPFSGMLFLLIQIPVIYALYFVFRSGIAIDGNMIYSFVSLPAQINPYFLGIDLSKPNIYLALLTAAAQFFQAKTAIPPSPKKEGQKGQMAEMSNMMMKQMMFFAPLLTFFVLFNLPAALGLYWLVTTVFSIIQQYYVFKKKNHA